MRTIRVKHKKKKVNTKETINKTDLPRTKLDFVGKYKQS